MPVEMSLLFLTLALRKFNAKVGHVYIQMPTTFDSVAVSEESEESSNDAPQTEAEIVNKNIKLQFVFPEPKSADDASARAVCLAPVWNDKTRRIRSTKDPRFVVICGDKSNNWRIITRNGHQNEIAGKR